MVMLGIAAFVGPKIPLYSGVDKLSLFENWFQVFTVVIPWICAFSQFLFNAIGHKGSERSKWNAFLNDSVET